MFELFGKHQTRRSTSPSAPFYTNSMSTSCYYMDALIIIIILLPLLILLVWNIDESFGIRLVIIVQGLVSTSLDYIKYMYGHVLKSVSGKKPRTIKPFRHLFVVLARLTPATSPVLYFIYTTCYGYFVQFGSRHVPVPVPVSVPVPVLCCSCPPITVTNMLLALIIGIKLLWISLHIIGIQTHHQFPPHYTLQMHNYGKDNREVSMYIVYIYNKFVPLPIKMIQRCIILVNLVLQWYYMVISLFIGLIISLLISVYVCIRMVSWVTFLFVFMEYHVIYFYM